MKSNLYNGMGRYSIYLYMFILVCVQLALRGSSTSVKETVTSATDSALSERLQNQDTVVRRDFLLDTLNSKKTLRSHFFPNPYPVAGDKHFVLTISFHGQYRAFIRLVFHDLDLPASAILVIYDGKDLLSPKHQVQPSIHKGVWRRPVLQSSDKYLTLYYYPGSAKRGSHTGFKATYWATRSRIWTEIPYTECPAVSLDSVMPGGSVTLRSRSVTGLRFMYDCIWQIKVPYHGLKVYLNYKLWNSEGCSLVIREWISSEGIVLRNYSTVTGSITTGLLGGFPLVESSRGLFVSFSGCRVWSQVKLSLTFGVYREWGPNSLSATDPSKHDCWLRFNTQYGKKIMHSKMDGFVCEAVRLSYMRMCLPLEAKCDGIRNCPDGSDEKLANCPTESKSHSGNCDGPGKCKCHVWEKRCDSGQCVHASLLCSEDCYPGEKWCSSGQCISMLQTCPLGDCPDGKPFMCRNGHCYGKLEQCDGFDDCGDFTDENHCPHSTYTASFAHWWYYLTIPAILVFTAASSFLCCRRRNHRQLHLALYNNSTNIHVDNFTALMNRHHAQFDGLPADGAPYLPGPRPPDYDEVITAVSSHDITDGGGNDDVLPPSYDDVCHVTTTSLQNVNTAEGASQQPTHETASDYHGNSNGREETSTQDPLLNADQVT